MQTAVWGASRWQQKLGNDPDEMTAKYIQELNAIVNAVRVGEDRPVVMPDQTAVAVRPT
jgi:hypothetical protein